MWLWPLQGDSMNLALTVQRTARNNLVQWLISGTMPSHHQQHWNSWSTAGRLAKQYLNEPWRGKVLRTLAVIEHSSDGCLHGHHILHILWFL